MHVENCLRFTIYNVFFFQHVTVMRRDPFTWIVTIKAYVSVSPTLWATDVINVDLHITESTLVGTKSLSRHILVNLINCTLSGIDIIYCCY